MFLRTSVRGKIFLSKYDRIGLEVSCDPAELEVVVRKVADILTGVAQVLVHAKQVHVRME